MSISHQRRSLVGNGSKEDFGDLCRQSKRLILGHHHHIMKCWHCENEAKAVCVFCGRGICATHRKGKPHFAGYGLKKRPILASIFHFASPTATCLSYSWFCLSPSIELVKNAFPKGTPRAAPVVVGVRQSSAPGHDGNESVPAATHNPRC